MGTHIKKLHKHNNSHNKIKYNITCLQGNWQGLKFCFVADRFRFTYVLEVWILRTVNFSFPSSGKTGYTVLVSST